MTHQAGLGGVCPLEELAQHLPVLGHELIDLVHYQYNHRQPRCWLPVACQLLAECRLRVRRNVRTACDSSPKGTVHGAGVRERSASKGMKVWRWKIALMMKESQSSYAKKLAMRPANRRKVGGAIVRGATSAGRGCSGKHGTILTNFVSSTFASYLLRPDIALDREINNNGLIKH